MGEHYQISRSMAAGHYAYLLSLPLVLHIPTLHTFVVHAGLLPLDPNRSVTSGRQPLAHIPAPPSVSTEAASNKNISVLRRAQEAAILTDIPQNVDPWVVLNMRSIRSDNSVTKSNNKGDPWADLWDSIIQRCNGFGSEDVSVVDANRLKKLPCYPSTVIYGHAAARGLDIKRWSKGLDSGCVYKRKLSALILSVPPEQLNVDSDSLPFGDQGSTIAQIASVECG